jgi:N-acylneuraminate cytidylyltransferase
MKIAVIPARGGSKRIPRKNIRDFCGQPIMAYSVLAARNSSIFDDILVSTDDEEIAAIAEQFGGSAPFRRPPELADDHAPTLPVVAHAIRWFEEHRGPVECCCCIYATAPFLQPDDLRQGLAVLESHPDAEFAFSVTSYAFPIQRALQVSDDGLVSMLFPEHELTRSQDLPGTCHDAGQFYWGRREAFYHHQGVFRARSYAVLLPRHRVQDIDTLEDWELAERMFRSCHQPRLPGCATSDNSNNLGGLPL